MKGDGDMIYRRKKRVLGSEVLGSSGSESEGVGVVGGERVVETEFVVKVVGYGRPEKVQREQLEALCRDLFLSFQTGTAVRDPQGDWWRWQLARVDKNGSYLGAGLVRVEADGSSSGVGSF